MSVKQSDGGWTNVAIIGPANHGKSTLAGFLLYRLFEVDEKTMQEAKQAAEARGDPSRAFAFLLDRQPQERTTDTGRGRGQSRETSRWGFELAGKPYLLMDSPGHYSRVRHVVGALSEADAAVLVVDADALLDAAQNREAERDKFKRVVPGLLGQVRAYLSVAHFYGIRQLVVAIHQMDRDSIRFSQDAYMRAEELVTPVITGTGWNLDQVTLLPTSVQTAKSTGHNITERSKSLSWFTGLTFREALEKLHPRDLATDAEFRMQVNGVFQGSRIHVRGHELVVTGKVLTGSVALNESVVIEPSGTQCSIRSIRSVDSQRAVRRYDRWHPQSIAQAGEIVGVSCRVTGFREGSIHSQEPRVTMGEMLARTGQASQVSNRFRAQLIVLSPPMLNDVLSGRVNGNIGLGYFRTWARVEQFRLRAQDPWHKVTHRSKIASEQLRVEDVLIAVNEGETVEVELVLDSPAPLDVHIEGSELGRLVLLDDSLFLIFGGLVTEVLEPLV